MDPELEQIIGWISAYGNAAPGSVAAGSARAAMNTAVDDYVGNVGPMPDDVAQQVNSVNASWNTLATATPPVPAPGAVPAAVSSAGLKLGTVVVPWAAVAAVGLFGFIAWHVSKKRRRN